MRSLRCHNFPVSHACSGDIGGLVQGIGSNFKGALSEMKRKAEDVIEQVSVDKHVNDDDIRAKLNELHHGFACSSEAEARFLVMCVAHP